MPVFVVTGPSGAGKGTLIKGLLERVACLEVAVSATTRPQRPGEVDGRDYWFLSDEEFTLRIEAGEFLEWVPYVSGAYSVKNSMFEVWLMVGFGLLGYAMKKLQYPIVPLILPMVLGKLFEKNLRQALVLSAGSLDVFYTRPITVAFLLIALLAYCSPLIRKALKKAGYGKATLNVESL